MNMQLDMSEVAAAITDFLGKRGVVVEDPRQVQLITLDASGNRIIIVNCTPVVVVTNVKLPEGGPYR